MTAAIKPITLSQMIAERGGTISPELAAARPYLPVMWLPDGTEVPTLAPPLSETPTHDPHEH